jgi:hypothetical protein
MQMNTYVNKNRFAAVQAESTGPAEKGCSMSEARSLGVCRGAHALNSGALAC